MTANRDCQWAATAGAPWISLSGGASGQGNGAVAFSVAPNAAVTPRTAGISVSGETFGVTQQPAPCSYAVSPSQISVDPNGGNATVTVQAQSGCAWTAASGASWIAIANGASGNGAGTIVLTAAPNPGGSRSGTVTVAGQAIAIDQPGASPSPGPPPPTPGPSPPPGGTTSCSSARIAPTTAPFGPDGGFGRLAISSPQPSGCTWTATSGASWVAIVSTSSGTGSATLLYLVSANRLDARSTTVTVAGQTLTINQAGRKGGN